MAKKIKFPLEMKDGIKVRTIEELRDNIDYEKLIEYCINKKLHIWLSDREYTEYVKQLELIDFSLEASIEKVCDVLGLRYEPNVVGSVNPITIKKNVEKQTYVESIVGEKIDIADPGLIATNQEEFEELLNNDAEIIYLCGDLFELPQNVKSVTINGINSPIVKIDSNKVVDFDKNEIIFNDVVFDEKYRELVEANERCYCKDFEYYIYEERDEFSNNELCGVDIIYMKNDVYIYGEKSYYYFERLGESDSFPGGYSDIIFVNKKINKKLNIRQLYDGYSGSIYYYFDKNKYYIMCFARGRVAYLYNVDIDTLKYNKIASFYSGYESNGLGSDLSFVVRNNHLYFRGDYIYVENYDMEAKRLKPALHTGSSLSSCRVLCYCDALYRFGDCDIINMISGKTVNLTDENNNKISIGYFVVNENYIYGIRFKDMSINYGDGYKKNCNIKKDELVVFNKETGKLVKRMKNKKGDIFSFAVNDEVLAVMSYDACISFYNSETLEYVESYDLKSMAKQQYDVDINNYKIGKISLLGEKMAITFSPEKIYEKIIYFVLNKGKEVK